MLFRKAAASQTGFEIKVKEDSVFVEFNKSGVGTRFKGANDVQIGEWQLLTVTRTSGVVNAYLNERQIISESYTEDVNNSQPLYIGTDQNINKFWQGSLDQVAINDLSVSQQEVLLIMPIIMK